MIKFELRHTKPWLKAIFFMLCFTIILVLAGRVSYMFPAGSNSLAFGLLGTIGGLFTVWLFKSAEHSTWDALGLAWKATTLLRFLIGISIGTLAFLMLIIPLVAFTSLEIKVTLEQFGKQALISLAPVLPLALMEEIGFRSYPLFTLRKSYGIWISMITMSFAFAGIHLLYGWSLQAAFTGPFVWAILFGLSAMWSKGIAIPTGIHFSLNVLQAITGMKGKDPASIWTLEYPPNVSQSQTQWADSLGLLLHVLMLILFLLLTRWYVSNWKFTPPSHP